MHKIEKKIILDKESPIFTAKADGNNICVEYKTYLDNYIILCAKFLSVVGASITKVELSLNMLNGELLKNISDDCVLLSFNI
jgi:hypothetical protein